MLALFPLEIVVYPGERFPLHIFEERYQQLLLDCETNGISFGVTTYLDKKLEYGTEVTLQKVNKRYSNGSSDAVFIGKRIFKIKSFNKQLPDKLYAGGEVEYLENKENGIQELQEELLKNIAGLYMELEVDKAPINHIPFVSYQVAHKVGLALYQEYHLLTLRSELERLNYLIGHLKITIPVLKEMNRTKEIIKRNGHFKNFDPLDFEDFKL